jgi:protein TonB
VRASKFLRFGEPRTNGPRDRALLFHSLSIRPRHGSAASKSGRRNNETRAAAPAPSPAPVEPLALAEAAPPPPAPAPVPTAEIPPIADLTAPPIAPVAPSTAKPPPPPITAPPLPRPAQSPPQLANPRAEPLRKAPVGAPPQSGPSESKPTNLALVTPKATSPAASSADLGEYQRTLFARLSAVKRYPDAARERAPQGVAVVSFSIGASGQVAGASISRSAGDAILGAEALATVRRASPFPPPPAGAPRTFSAPLSFRVR